MNRPNIFAALDGIDGAAADSDCVSRFLLRDVHDGTLNSYKDENYSKKDTDKSHNRHYCAIFAAAEGHLRPVGKTTIII